MELNRCMGCMYELQQGERICRHCGFDNQNARQPSYALPFGSVLRGRYMVGRELGRGGFGITYIGLDLTLDVRVAVKEYCPKGQATRYQNEATLEWNQSQESLSLRRQGYNSFLKEARKMARIDLIPSIVRVRDTFLENETAYIIMDYVEGMTLKEKLQREGPMTFTECFRLLEPMMEGLAKVHSMGLIHRDISPDNIMVQPDGSVRLLDLGAAKDTGIISGPETQRVVKSGYSPLEQYLEQGNIGPWTDVYALCATMYQCMTGVKPTPAIDRADTEQLYFPPGTKELPSAAVIGVLQEGLAVRPERRIPDMDVLLQRLRQAMSGGQSNHGKNAYGQMQRTDWGSSARQQRPLKKPVPYQKKGKAWIAVLAGVAAALVLMMSVVAVQYSSSSGTEDLYIEQLGTSNSNVLNCGGLMTAANNYEYFLDADLGLYVCIRDQNTDMYYLDDSEKVADNALYLLEGDGCIYYFSIVDGEYAICRMEYDGGGVETVYSNDDRFMEFVQYAKLSDNKEYLYFIQEEEEESYGQLCRYCLSDGKLEQLSGKQEVYWFNLYEDGIYMTLQKYDKQVLVHTDLRGRQRRVVDDENLFGAGLAQDGVLMLYSYEQEALMACSLQDGAESAFEVIPNCDLDGGSILCYENGWVYYTSGRDSYLHRVRMDGSDDHIVVKEYVADSVSIMNGWMRFCIECEEEETGEVGSQLCFAELDGSNAFEVFDPVAQ